MVSSKPHMDVVFIQNGRVDYLYTESIDALEGLGHRVRRFGEIASALAETSILQKADILVAPADTRIDSCVFGIAPELRALVSPVSGVEGFDLCSASENCVLVVHAPIPENYISVAEAAIMLILASLYDLAGSQAILRFNLPKPTAPRARMLMGKTVGLIGFGRIAASIAQRLDTWQLKLLAHTRTRRELPGNVAPVSLDHLLQSSDAVVIAVDLNADSRGMLTYDRLRQMKTNSVLVNVSRSGVAGDDEIARFASSRPDVRIALDVFDTMPLSGDSPLRSLDNAILTPHMVGYTRECHDRLPITLRENIERVAAGSVPDFVRNPDVVDRWMDRFGRRGYLLSAPNDS